MNKMANTDQGVLQVSPDTECREISVGSNVTALAFADGAIVAGLGDGRVVAVRDGEAVTLCTHDSVVTALSCTADGVIVSAGQDGRVQAMRGDDGARDVVSAKDEWITTLCHSSDGTKLAIACGKRVEVIEDGDVIARLDDLPSTVSGIAFFNKSNQLAISHYNGISLWDCTRLARPEVLSWAGSIIGASVSPDGRYVAGPTQDREVHIWDLVTGKDYRLGGYQKKVKSIGWTHDAPYLYSTGADVLVAWGLSADPGTLPPREIGYAFAQTVSAIAGTCETGAMPAGFTDGSIILGEAAKGTAKIVRRASGAPVTTLTTAARGGFCFGTACGKVGFFGRSTG